MTTSWGHLIFLLTITLPAVYVGYDILKDSFKHFKNKYLR
mgnify:CR=1 FL=1